jgi:peptidoglycan/xylan/chitin deacetylase (PgdA/CDA1 family)
MRIAENITQHQYLYDTGSFGPDGRTQIYPPVFHFFSALLLQFMAPETAARWTPPFMFCLIIFLWYFLIATYYKKSTALLSSLLLLTVPAFIDLGFLFSPQPFSLILIFAGLLFFKKNPFITGFFGGIIIMTHFTGAFYFFLVISVLSLLKRNKAGLTIAAVSFITASPYLIYFFCNFPTIKPVLGIPDLKYFISKTTFAIPALAILGLRKDTFATALSAGALLALVQPTNFCYITFPLVLFSALFVQTFFLHRKWAVIAFIFIFWALLIPSHQYTFKLQPAASEYSSFVWLNQNSVSSVIASGWYQAPIIAAVADRTPVLGFSFPDETRVSDMEHLYKGDTLLLDFYDISYVYCGAHEEYDYQTVALPLDKVYTGKGAFYKREPPLIFILITADIEYDLPPVLSTYHGMEKGLPYITSVLDTYHIKATFFVLGETAVDYPEQIRTLAQSHQIGCHSMHHHDMRQLSFAEKKAAVQDATSILQELTGSDITAFRAPGHSCDTDLIHILMDNNYPIEASACTQLYYPYHPSSKDWLSHGDLPLLRVPISHTPSYFYAPLLYPRSWVNAYVTALHLQEYPVKIIVIGIHPWEFVDISAPDYQQYTQACGTYARTEFEHLLTTLTKRRVTFLTMDQLLNLWEIIENHLYQ